MEGVDTERVTQLLTDDRLDDAQRTSALLPLLYDHLRLAAGRALANERPDHTLQATALVHEAWLRLCGDRKIPWKGQAHFYVAAAEAMRRVLLDHARSRDRLKRGGQRKRTLLELDNVMDLSTRDSFDVARFDEAVGALGAQWPDAALVLRLRFFSGLSVAQCAQVIGASESTVKRHWSFARAWLAAHLKECDSLESGMEA